MKWQKFNDNQIIDAVIPIPDSGNAASAWGIQKL